MVKNYLWSLLLLTLLVGCPGGGGATPVEVTDPEEVSIRDVVDATHSGIEEDAFKALFAGDAPKMKDFQAKYYCNFPQLKPNVSITGDTATVDVEVSFDEGEGQFSEPTIKTWTMQKTGGTWTIQDYPVD